MKTSVAGIVVFCLAGRAHRKATHRRLGTIVGDVLDDGEARAAIGAIDERIAVAPVPRIEKLMQAIDADCGIGRDERLTFAVGLAVGNHKLCLVARGDRLDRQRIDAREWRELLAYGLPKRVQLLAGTLDLNGHAAAVVQHKSCQSMLVCLPIDKGAEADTLHDALNEQTPALYRWIFYRCHSARPFHIYLIVGVWLSACANVISHSHHVSSPSPVRQLSSKMRKCGLTARASFLTVATS